MRGINDRGELKRQSIELSNLALDNQNLLAIFREDMFTAGSTVNLQPGTTLALYNYDKRLAGKPPINIWQAALLNIKEGEGGGIHSNKKFPLGRWILEEIHTTCFMMSFIDDKEKMERFALDRSQQLIERLKIILRGMRSSLLDPSNIPETFFEKLLQTLNISVLLSYNPAKSKKYVRDTLLLGTYFNEGSPSQLANMVKQKRVLYEDTFLTGEWEESEARTILGKIKNFYTEVVTEYVGTTQLKKGQLRAAFIAFIISFGGLGGWIGYVFDITGGWLTIPVVVGALIGIRLGLWYKTNWAGYILNQDKATSFARSAQLHFDQLKPMEKPEYLRNITSRQFRRLPNKEKIKISLGGQYRKHLRLDWRKHQAITEAKTSGATEPAYSLDYALSTDSGEGAIRNSYSQYTYESAYGAFEKTRRVGRIPKGRGTPGTFGTLSTQIPTASATLNIDFGSKVNHRMYYNENDLENSTMFPFRSGGERQFVWVDPQLQSEIDWKDCHRKLQNLKPRDIEQMYGDIRDFATKDSMECWEFRLAEGVRILGSPIQISHAGTIYTVYAFNTKAPRKVGSSDKTPLPAALAAPLPVISASSSSGSVASSSNTFLSSEHPKRPDTPKVTITSGRQLLP